MKKLATLACVALTLASHAAYEKFALVRLADTVSVTNAMTKLGENIGSPGLGAGIGYSLANTTAARLLGAQRAGASLGYVVYAQGDEGKALSISNLTAGVEEVMLYPSTLTQKDFLAQHKDATVTNGVVTLVATDEFDQLTTNYFAFAADGKWVAYASNAALARAALSETNAFENAAFDGNICDITLESIAWACATYTNEINAALLKDMGGLKFGLRVNEAGLDVRGELALKKDSALAKLYSAKIQGAPLAFADKDTLFAGEYAAEEESVSYAKVLKCFKAFLTKQGLKADAFDLQETNNVTRLTLDIQRLLADNKDNTNKMAFAQSPETLLADLDFLKECRTKDATNNAPGKVAFTLKGAKGSYSPAERFAAVLPELKGKPLFSAFAGSFYGFARIIVVQLMASQAETEDAAKIVSFMLAGLPNAGLDGTAGAYWFEGGNLHFQFRFSAGELKGISSLTCALPGAGLGGDEEEIEEEEEVDETVEEVPDDTAEEIPAAEPQK